MVKSKRMMETDKKTGIKRQFMPVTHVSAVLGLREFIQGNFFQADFDRVMGMLQEHYDKASAEIDQKAENIEKYANEKIDEFDGKLSDSNKRMTALEKEIQETQQIIEENDIPTRQEISANVIYQLIGKDEVEMTFTMDFLGKIVGSDTENFNKIGTGNYPDIMPPDSYKGEMTQGGYNQAYKKDDLVINWQAPVNGTRAALCLNFNILEALKRQLGERFFTSQGAKSNTECVEIVRKIVTRRQFSSWVLGSSPGGPKINLRMWSRVTNTWLGSAGSTSDSISLVTMEGLENTNIHYISDDGIISVLLYAEPSDGDTSSVVKLDYTSLDVKIRISANDFFQSVIAAYHREMGLSNLVFKKVGEV